jgi:hypothetical protein
MSTSIEIEVESESCDCCADCKMGKGGAAAEPNKDVMLAELKKLLAENGSNGLAERQMKIDELISKISELGD